MWFLTPGITFQTVLIRLLVSTLIIFFILPLHEYAHGLAAFKLGDKTAKYRGRLSLNPLTHIDPIGALMIFLCGFGWEKPVPIDPRYFKNPKKDMAIVAIAGPLSNILAAVAGGLLLNFLYLFKTGLNPLLLSIFNDFISYYIIINISLAVFNLIPIPPLDGSKILMAFLPDHILYQYYRYEQIISIMGMFLLFRYSFRGGMLDNTRYLLTKFILWLTHLPFSFWG
jgi:Zn-dependent protease